MNSLIESKYGFVNVWIFFSQGKLTKLSSTKRLLIIAKINLIRSGVEFIRSNTEYKKICKNLLKWTLICRIILLKVHEKFLMDSIHLSIPLLKYSICLNFLRSIWYSLYIFNSSSSLIIGSFSSESDLQSVYLRILNIKTKFFILR